ncbi:MAG: MAPEG family protein [Steroidobacteraceae bacterium]
MNPGDIFWPACAQVALTLAVMVRMYVVRLTEMRVRHIDPQDIATSRAAAGRLENVVPADNFRNLFEVPVLFFAICPILYATNSVTAPQIALAWAFVAGRCIHSFIHVTNNRVTHRFTAFVFSALCVFAMWLIFALHF